MNIPHADYYFNITGKTNLNQKDEKIKTMLIPKPWKHNSHRKVSVNGFLKNRLLLIVIIYG